MHVSPFTVSHHVPSHIPTIKSQIVNNKSCLLCVKSAKYVFRVTLKPVESMRPGKDKLCTIHYWQGKADLCILKLTSGFHHLPRLALLGCTREANSS